MKEKIIYINGYETDYKVFQSYMISAIEGENKHSILYKFIDYGKLDICISRNT